MLTVDGKSVEFKSGQNLLEACLAAGVYIPHLCYHPSIPSCENNHGCGLCKVSVDDRSEPVNACQISADSVATVTTDSEAVITARKENLARMLATHPHACLQCPASEGCARTECSQSVNVPERCCSLFGNCEVQKVAAYIGIPDNTQRYRSAGLPIVKDQPFYDIDYNLCIACGRCLRICRDVKTVDVFKISEEFGRPVAIPKNGTLKDSGCIFCGACVEVCPTGTLMDKPWEYDGKAKSVVPCRATCPSEIDVPKYVRLVAENRCGEAVAVIREKAPIPGILGRVCYNPCESGCRRKVWDQAVGIRSLKRFAADNDDGYWKRTVVVGSPTGKKVAVVGAGPAGLSASYYLALFGHTVDLYDAMDKPGGMLRYGIPDYRLPQQVLDKEIEDILNLGVAFHGGTKISTPEEVTGRDAIFWATGASRSVSLPKGIDKCNSVVDGLEFLRSVNSGENISLLGQVVVIGGGNVATDVARCAARLGADKVTIVYRRTRAEMPAYESEIDEALMEGVTIRFLEAPTLVESDGARITVTCQRMKLGEPDTSGRSAPVPVEGEQLEIICDHLYSAIGQKVETIGAFKVSDNGTIAVDTSSNETSMKSVYAGGDNVLGPSSVVAAVQEGRKAGQAIDQQLGGSGELFDYNIEVSEQLTASEESMARDSSMRSAPCLKAEQRKAFDEIEQAYTKSAAIAEASRCSRCDLRLSIPAVILPPDKYLCFNRGMIDTVPDEPGVLSLYDSQKNLVLVCGTENMRTELADRSDDNLSAAYITFERHQMYTQRESEILSQHLQKHGQLPTGNDLDEDLF